MHASTCWLLHLGAPHRFQVTIDIDTGAKGHKQFIYDQCFGPTSTQEQVFEDTENLIQSAFDGYNVAIFAYGQTGACQCGCVVVSLLRPAAMRHSARVLCVEPLRLCVQAPARPTPWSATRTCQASRREP